MSMSGTPACTCKRSACLKLYCECFKAERECVPACRCVGCKNTREHTTLQAYTDAANKRRTRLPTSYCACKKGCLKKYCVCFKDSRPCGDTCRCDRSDCLNGTSPQSPMNIPPRSPIDPPARPEKKRRIQHIPSYIHTLFSADDSPADLASNLAFPCDVFGFSPTIIDNECALLQVFNEIEETHLLSDEHQPTPHRLSFSCIL
mgnify:CR=1 FL=1